MTYAIASARKAEWNLAGYPGGTIPTAAAWVSVKDYGAKGDGSADDTAAFERAILDCPGTAATPRAIIVPVGTYRIRRQLTLKDGRVFRGAGSKTTRLKFTISGTSDAQCFKMVGSGSGNWNSISSGYTHGSKTLVVKSAVGLVAGAYVEIQQSNDAAAMYTNPTWNAGWARDAVGEINKIASVTGLTVTLENSIIHTNYKVSCSPLIQAISPVRNCGLEAFYVTKEDQGAAGSNYGCFFFFDYATACWVKDVETEKANYIHVVMSRSLQCEVRGSYMHHAWGSYPTSQAYHFDVRVHSTLNLFEDNALLYGKGFWPAMGACGNVYGYNFCDKVTDSHSWNYDCECHGHWNEFNLVEGNVVAFPTIGDYWGPAPNNTVARNLVATYISIKEGNNTNVIGNELPNAAGRILVYSGPTGTIQHANEIKGVITYADGADHTLPNSFYKSAVPSWWENGAPWPAFGPDVANGTIPAKRRYASGNPVRQPGEISLPPPPPPIPPAPPATTEATYPVHFTSKIFAVTFSVTPKAAASDVTFSLMYSACPPQTSIFQKYACTLRISTANVWDARNGAGYAAATVKAYAANTTYACRIVVDILNHRYDAYVDGVPIAIAYDFRTEQAKVESLDQFVVVIVAGSVEYSSLVTID